MAKLFTHRGLVLPIANWGDGSWLDFDETPHPDSRLGEVPVDTCFNGSLSQEAKQYWNEFLDLVNCPNVSPFTWFVSEPTHISLWEQL
jgi:hypothetical protein